MPKAKTPSRTTSPEPSLKTCAPDALHRLVLDTAYDQTEVLDVPVFDPSTKLRTILYSEVAVTGIALNGELPATFANAAAAVGRVISATQRFEPQNQTPMHRSYASPRSLYPVQVDFVFSGAGGSLRLRYDEENHAICGRDADFPDGDLTLRLEVVGVLERISPLYGDLGPTLCALEAGHVASQLRNACEEYGLNIEALFAGTDGRHIRQNGSPHGDYFILASLEIDQPVLLSNSERPQPQSLRLAKPSLERDDCQRVSHAFDRLASAPVDAVAMPPPKFTAAMQSLSDAAADGKLRTSGHFPSGIFGRAVAPAKVDDLCERFVIAYGELAKTPAHADLGVQLLRPTGNGNVEVIDAANAHRPVQHANADSSLADAFGSHYNIDLQTIPLFVIFSAPFGRIMRDKGSWSYIHTLSTAGNLAQHFCLQAAVDGFFARPFKGAISKVLEHGFGISGQVFYSMIVGQRTPPIAHYSLAPLEGQV